MISLNSISGKQTNGYARSSEVSCDFSESMKSSEILEYVGDAVITVNLHGDITYMNRMAESLTGFNRDAGIGRPLKQIFRVLDATTRQPRADLAQRAIETNAFVPLENNALLIARYERELAIEDSAAPLHASDNSLIGAVIMFHDSRYSSEVTAKMRDLARHDHLTGLLNRYAFEERFEQSLSLARRHNKKMGLFFIDLDKFKAVNDAWGHDGGDAVLKAVADMLSSCMRNADSAARYGGDEFVVLLSELEHPDHIFVVAEKVREMAMRLKLADGSLAGLDISIGVSIYPENGDTLEELLQEADAAMYRNKVSLNNGNPVVVP